MSKRKNENIAVEGKTNEVVEDKTNEAVIEDREDDNREVEDFEKKYKELYTQYEKLKQDYDLQKTRLDKLIECNDKKTLANSKIAFAYIINDIENYPGNSFTTKDNKKITIYSDSWAKEVAYKNGIIDNRNINEVKVVHLQSKEVLKACTEYLQNGATDQFKILEFSKRQVLLVEDSVE